MSSLISLHVDNISETTFPIQYILLFCFASNIKEGKQLYGRDHFKILNANLPPSQRKKRKLFDLPSRKSQHPYYANFTNRAKVFQAQLFFVCVCFSVPFTFISTVYWNHWVECE